MIIFHMCYSCEIVTHPKVLNWIIGLRTGPKLSGVPEPFGICSSVGLGLKIAHVEESSIPHRDPFRLE